MGQGQFQIFVTFFWDTVVNGVTSYEYNSEDIFQLYKGLYFLDY